MSELSYEASDEASENELLERSLSVWRGWSSIREDFTPIPLDIHTASSIGTYDCVRTLIARGEVEIDRKNIGGWTPLMYACYIGHDHIVNLLIDAGCNVNLKNQRGQTPLMLAASCGNESVGRTLLRKGAELEAADCNGWTALFHATYSGHQNFVSFLLDQRANMDAVEPRTGMTPFMEAAVEGHEIIVQLFLQRGVHVNVKAYNGDTARSLALMYGYMKIVSLIDNHVMPHSTLRSEPGLDDYLSSSDEVDKRQRPQHQRSSRAKSKGPSIRDGPEAIARMIDRTRTSDQVRYPHLVVPRGYVTFPHGEGERADIQLSYRDVTSPINQEDYRLDSSGGKDSCDYNDDSNAFSKTGAITIKSSSSSSGGLIAALGLSRQNSADSDDFVLHDSGVHNSSQSEDNARSRPVRGNTDAAVAGSSHAEEGGSVKPAENAGHGSVPGQESGAGSTGLDSSSSHTTGSIPRPGCAGEAGVELCGQTEGNESTLGLAAQAASAEDMLVVTKGSEGDLDCGIQYGDVAFPDVLEDTCGEQVAGDLCVDSYMTGAPAASVTTHADSVSQGRNQKSDPSMAPAGLASGSGMPPVSHEAVRGLPFGDKSPGKHLQRRGSCQARLSRLSVGERDNINQTSETRHRRRSANSPPTFHREFGGRGQDAGHGTGRVSCLSDIPSNPGPLAGYPVTTATPVIPSPHVAVTERRDDTGDGGDRRFTGFHQHQIPVAAVAPTCVPPNYPSGSAFSAPLPPQSPRKNSAPDVTPVAGPAPDPVNQDGFQSDTTASCSTDKVPPPSSSSLSALVRELPGGEGGGVGGRGECDLAALLDQLGLSKYTAVFVEQDVDLQVFLSLTDNDLKEIGIKLFGPRKKMTNAIARWHSQAPAARSSLEQAYADRLEGEMQEMAIQLNQAYDNVEKLKAQVLQERQLRSVTESCLMEERATWQRTHHTLVDAHQRLQNLTETLSKLSSCLSELKRRVGKPQNHTHTRNTSTGDSELLSLSIEQMTELFEQHLYDMHQNCAALAHHMDHVVSSPPSTGGIHDARDVESDFP